MIASGIVILTISVVKCESKNLFCRRFITIFGYWPTESGTVVSCDVHPGILWVDCPVSSAVYSVTISRCYTYADIHTVLKLKEQNSIHDFCYRLG